MFYLHHQLENTKLMTVSPFQTILGRFAPGADRVVKDDGYDDVGAIGQGLNGKLGTGVNSLTNNGTTGPWNIWNPIGPSYQATSVDRRSGKKKHL